MNISCLVRIHTKHGKALKSSFMALRWNSYDYCEQQQEQNPTPIGFLRWGKMIEGVTQRFLFDFVFTIGLSIYVQRVGDRNNDVQVSRAGRMTFLGMFYGFNHPIYREVEYSELRNNVLFPKQVKNHTYTESCGNQKSTKGERVKRMKMIAPKGKMSTEMWQRVARNVDSVDAIVKNGMSLLGIREDDQYDIRFTPIEKEVILWRAHLRYRNYLYTNSNSVVDIHGDELNSKLVYFLDNLNELHKLYFEKALTQNIENIRYPIIKVSSNDIMEEIQSYHCEFED